MEPTLLSATETPTQSELQSAPSACWHLEISDGKSCRRHQIEEGQSLSFGASSRVGVQLDDIAVSALHGEVGVRDGRLWVRDAGSRNGTYVGGAIVPSATFSASGCFVAGRTVLAFAPGSDDDGEDASDEPPLDGVIGQSMPMRRLARAVRRLAGLRAPVLIRGETGTGKELVAHALHRLSPRAKAPFVPINMGSVSPEMADGELFGHERGAFTGAVATRAGVFEAARGGTLFLDEVAELPPLAQSKLLRALENGEVRPVGTAQARQVDVRVVAASWASLEERMARGAFREDLFHRLAVLTVQVPPLRERRADVALLAVSLLGALAPDVGERRLTASALSQLTSHDWPGNVRELKNVLLRAAVLAPGRTLAGEHIDQALVPFRAAAPVSPAQRRRDAQRALDQHEGNRSRAARSLGVPRSTFRDWIAPSKKP